MKCEGCKYWQCDTDKKDDTEVEVGECHRHAPVPTFYLFEDDDDKPDPPDGEHYVRYITTYWDDWCGEFQARSVSADKPVFQDVAWSVRTRKSLRKLGVDSWEKLTEKTDFDLLSLKNFGQTSLYEVKKKLKEYGLHLKS